jgi:hypothetical protein
MPVEDVVCENLSFYLDPENTKPARRIWPRAWRRNAAPASSRFADKPRCNTDISDQLGPAVTLIDVRCGAGRPESALKSGDDPLIQLERVQDARVKDVVGPGDAKLRPLSPARVPGHSI